jgi:hypothetical protein
MPWNGHVEARMSHSLMKCWPAWTSYQPRVITASARARLLQARQADGYCPAGTVRERGSEHLRRGQEERGTAANLANGNYAAVVGTLLGTNAPQGGYYGVAGSTALPAGIGTLSQRTLRNGCDRVAMGLYNPSLAASQTNIPTRCFPEDYFAANPQLNAATYTTNLGSSNYHALQVQLSLRPTAGFLSSPPIAGRSPCRWRAHSRIPLSGTWTASEGRKGRIVSA